MEINEFDFQFSDSELQKDENNNDSRELSDIPKEERILRTQAYDKSVSDVVNMMTNDDILLNPDYQRMYIWDNKKASLLIESLLLNVPIPVIYVAEDDESKWNVVDGLQRLETLRRFFANEFKLRGLEVLSELNGTQYSLLPPKAARILRNGILRIILIFRESHPDIKYEIFMRLNRGSVRLTEQELRNCLYRGSFNELLKELREYPHFLEMLNRYEPHKRMSDAELILRFFTISDSYNFEKAELSSEYTGKVVSSLNKFIEKNRNLSNEKIEKYRKRFFLTADKVYSVFGGNAFKKLNPDGTLDSSLINRAIMDIQMVSFEQINKEKLIGSKEKIINLLCNLPIQDPKFLDAITFATSDRKQLEYRLSTWINELKNILR